MQGKRDQIGTGKRTSEVAPAELEWHKLLAKLNEFVADSDLSIPRIARLMGVSQPMFNTFWRESATFSREEGRVAENPSDK